MLRSLTAAAVLSATLATPSLAFDPANMTPTEQQGFRDAVRAYLLDNPEVIFEAVEVFRAREEAAAAAQEDAMVLSNAEAIFNDGYSYVGGNPEGDITLVEFMDYRCGYCRKAFTEVEELIATDGNIRFIVKELPILGEASLEMSKFAIAVKQLHGFDAYKAVHDTLMNFSAEPSPESLGEVADLLGLDADEILVRMNSDAVMAEIQDTALLAQRLQVNGTPSFVLGEEMIRGYVPLDTMRELVADLRSQN